MSARCSIRNFLAVLLVIGGTTAAFGQVWQPFGPVDYRHDFAPFETFDIKNMSNAPDPHEGFFFTFDKVSWSVSGEHVTVGNNNVLRRYPNTFRQLTGAPPIVINGILDGPPEAKFGWGERYEFGYVVDHHGWTVSALDGPDVSHQEVFGFNDSEFDSDINTDILVIPNNPASGNVAVLFSADPNSLTGFLFIDTDGDGETETPVDLNANALFDFGDTILFIPTFDEVVVRSHTEMDGVDLMKVFRFKPTHKGSVVEFSYGARYLRLRDKYDVIANGGVLNDHNLPIDAANPEDDGNSFWNTQIDNHIVGPQVALRWFKRQGRFTYNVAGRFTFGYNVQDFDQRGQMGTALTFEQMGQLNSINATILTPVQNGQPMLASNTAFRHGKQDQDFSPLVEFRTEASYHLTQQFAVKLGFNATFIDNIRRAGPAVLYRFPNMGFRDVGTQEIFVAGVNIGAEFNR